MKKLLMSFLVILAIDSATMAAGFYSGNHIIDYKIEDELARVGGANVTLAPGGIVTNIFLDAGNLTISGGEVLGWVGSDCETCFITAGTIWGGVGSSDWGNNVEISGGIIHGNLQAGDSATITIKGTGFNYNYGRIPLESGHLTGTLANGDPISVDFFLSEANPNGIILAIPEPTTIAMLGLGGLIYLREWKK